MEKLKIIPGKIWGDFNGDISRWSFVLIFRDIPKRYSLVHPGELLGKLLEELLELQTTLVTVLLEEIFEGFSLVMPGKKSLKILRWILGLIYEKMIENSSRSSRNNSWRNSLENLWKKFLKNKLERFLGKSSITFLRKFLDEHHRRMSGGYLEKFLKNTRSVCWKISRGILWWVRAIHKKVLEGIWRTNFEDSPRVVPEKNYWSFWRSFWKKPRDIYKDILKKFEE